MDFIDLFGGLGPLGTLLLGTVAVLAWLYKTFSERDSLEAKADHAATETFENVVEELRTQLEELKNDVSGLTTELNKERRQNEQNQERIKALEESEAKSQVEVVRLTATNEALLSMLTQLAAEKARDNLSEAVMNAIVKTKEEKAES